MRVITDRGQSSIVGSILLLGLVVVGTTIVGGYGLYTVTQTADSSESFVNCEIEYVDEAVVVTQTGGDSVDEAALDVVFRNASGESRVDFAIDDGDGDTAFETGESARLGTVTTETTLVVVTEQSVICRATVTPTDGTGTDDGDDRGGDADESDEDDEDERDADEDDESVESEDDEGEDDESDEEDERDEDESDDTGDDEVGEGDGDDGSWWWEWLTGGGDDDGGDDSDSEEGDGGDGDGGRWDWRGWWPW